jgi:type IV pilus assembly protein PilE
VSDRDKAIPAAPASKRGGAGFTLLELMIVVAVIAGLAAIALPVYQNAVSKGRRADGTTALLDLANRMQRYYSEHDTFATATIAAGNTTTDVLASATSPQGHYTLQIDSGTLTATFYKIRATRAGAQTVDTRCGNLTFTSTSIKGIESAAAGVTWDQCW